MLVDDLEGHASLAHRAVYEVCTMYEEVLVESSQVHGYTYYLRCSRCWVWVVRRGWRTIRGCEKSF